VLLCVFVVVALVAVCTKAYVFPRSDELHKADVIFVLGSGDRERYQLGIDLYKRGYAPNLVFSVPPVDKDRPGCEVPLDGITADCYEPNPPTTRGEGAELARRSAENGWKSAIVVTIDPHLMRARWIISRCNHGDLMFVGARPHISALAWARQAVHQSFGFVKALIQPGCEELL
jgi:hypothetical protein